jgi:hypothetical protein
MRVRQSSLKQFGKCARQYYYSQILDLGGDQQGSLTVFGTIVHYAIDVYENYGYDLDLAIRTFRHYWDHPEELGETIDFWHRRSTKPGLQKRGIEMLRKYHELAPWTEGKLLGTEIHFVVPLGDHELEGTIDKLWYRPGQKKVEVIDFKTSALVPEKLRYNIQFTAYCYATERPEFWEFVPGWEHGYQEFYGWQRAGWWYHARRNKMFNAGKRGPDDYKRLLLSVEEMEKAIELQVFPLDYSGESCGWCAYAEGVCGSEMEDPAETALVLPGMEKE